MAVSRSATAVWAGNLTEGRGFVSSNTSAQPRREAGGRLDRGQQPSRGQGQGARRRRGCLCRGGREGQGWLSHLAGAQGQRQAVGRSDARVAGSTDVPPLENLQRVPLYHLEALERQGIFTTG